MGCCGFGAPTQGSLGGEGAVIKMTDENGGKLTMNEEGKLIKEDGSEYKIQVQVRHGETFAPEEQTATWANIPIDKLPENAKII